ncbi:MAG: F0F1 ATP synthase subunit B [Candidatus Levybacteria bacterium]|nr:F0F1 ATP synthase subunit B [Candidatus Levybacteria bacterium]
MELLNNFGVDPVLLIAQALNFLIIIFILKRFLYKPILEMLKKRKEEVETGLKQAEEAGRLLEDSQIKEKEILKGAKLHAQQIISDAKLQAVEEAEEIGQAARLRAQRLIEDAGRQIELSEKETEKKLAVYVSKLAIELITKSSKQLFSDKEQREIVQNALRKFKQ